jgi:hypothetical protein
MERQNGEQTRTAEDIATEKLERLQYIFWSYNKAFQRLIDDSRKASELPESIATVSDVVVAHVRNCHEKLFEAMTNNDGREIVVETTEVRFPYGNIRNQPRRLETCQVSIMPTALLSHETSSCGQSVIVATTVDEQQRFYEIHKILDITC